MSPVSEASRRLHCVPKNSPKIQRWVDLLAALLARRQPATFEELSRDVPAYLDVKQSKAARMRMFERDKDELRAFGIPITSVVSADGETHGYKLAPSNFYLPYLALLSEHGTTKARRVDRWGGGVGTEVRVRVSD